MYLLSLKVASFTISPTGRFMFDFLWLMSKISQ